LLNLEEFRSIELPEEGVLMKDWSGDLTKPLVSVLCNTYNHARYIEDALRGFLIQKTNFPFEVIVHDDASLDETKDIVLRYVNRYPRVIKLIAQKENQYSKGIKPTTLSFPFSQGAFIALCEGDDFWIDEYKLQKQVVLLKQREEVAICVHSCHALEPSGRIVECYISSPQSIEFDAQDVASKLGQYAPTASYVMRRSVVETIPEWFNKTAVGDFYWELNGSTIGKGHYIKDVMSVYRLGAIGSWSSNFSKDFTSTILRNSSNWLEDLDRVENEPRFSRLDVSKRRSLHCYYIALARILDGDYCRYRQSIELSFKIFPGLSKAQVSLFYARRVPFFSRLLAKKIIKK